MKQKEEEFSIHADPYMKWDGKPWGKNQCFHCLNRSDVDGSCALFSREESLQRSLSDDCDSFDEKKK